MNFETKSTVSPSNLSQEDSMREKYISDSQPSMRQDFKLNMSTLNHTESKCTSEGLNLLENEEFHMEPMSND